MMCGIAAIVGRKSVVSSDGWKMAAALRHRGPDGAGVATFTNGRVTVARSPDEVPSVGDVILSHTRLSIIDLSPAGFQPMSDETGRFWIVYNGEIYNFAELRRELEGRGHRFASRTDTEVLVHGWDEWGLSLLDRIQGMFAFCLHDRERGSTVLVRDRLGIKPLYYATRSDGAFVAASEIGGLLAAGVEARLDPQGLDRFLTWLWVPDPETAFEGIQKLPPGHVLELDRAGRSTCRPYWDFVYELDDASPASQAGNLREAVERAVSRQLVSDVPVGAFFSGGLDSTAVVEVMRRRLAPDLPTCFTVGFTKRDLTHDVVADDLRFSRFYAERHPVDYREEILRPNLVEALPKVIRYLGEPIADPAALSAHAICEAARGSCTVLLSGVGGDELFAGYPRYVAAQLARRFRRLPPSLQRALTGTVRLLPAAGAGRLARFGRNANKLLAHADCDFPDDYLGFLTYFDAPARRTLYASEFRAELGSSDARHREHLARVSNEDWLHQAMYLDLKTFLPALNLTYMDRMSMAHSIEVRVPLLDEQVHEVVRRAGPEMKLRGAEGKLLFKTAMRGLVPDEIVARPKSGFTAPVRGWLAHEVRPLVDDLLSADAVRRRGLFKPEAVERLVADFRTGRRDNALQIWQLLTLELWHEAFIDGSGGAATATAHSGPAA